MKTQENKKKVWTKPAVQALNIKKDTFSGSGEGAEGAGKWGPPTKS
jgi:hypothetical protein